MRRVLVTGGTRGIGHSIVLSLKKQGYKVAVVYVRNDELAEQMEKEHGIKGFKWDVSDFEQCRSGVKKVEEYLDGNIEVLINNAGIARDGMLHKQSEANWRVVLESNLFSVFNMSRAVIEQMRAAKFGRIVNVSSVNAHGMLGQTNYSAAKAGIEGFTKALAIEGARCNITVNAVAPGYANTDMMSAVPKEALAQVVARIPMGRLGEVEEVARAVLFLADDLSSFITGAILPINGGLRMY